MARSIQGTATNNTSDQTEKQREGVHFSSNTTASSLFDKAPDPRGIMNRALAKMVGTSSSNIPDGENPDFSEGVVASELYNYTKGNNKFNDVENAKDAPAIFGPNLKAPDINNPPTDSTGDTTGETILTGTQKTINQVTADSNYETNGYGIETEYNDPRRDSSYGKGFLHRRDRTATSTKLGELFDTDKYEYNESE